MKLEFSRQISKNTQKSDFMKINTELPLGISTVVNTEVNTGQLRRGKVDKTVCCYLPANVMSYFRHLFPYANQTHIFYLLHIHTTFLLHVSVYLTTYSGIT